MHVHKATGVLRPGNVSLADSYVKVFYNGKEVSIGNLYIFARWKTIVY